MAIAFLLLPTNAPAQNDTAILSGVVDCGGRDERACHREANEREMRFWNRYLANCERGLVERDGFCRNEKRRQGIGQAYRRSWEGRALAFQRYVLGADRGYGNVTGITAHNAFENDVDGYVGSSHPYSITEMLDAGVHQLELDVYSSTNEPPLVCHGACSAWDRTFASVAKEIRDWMLEPANEDAMVFIQLEAHYSSESIALLNDVIRTYLDIPGIGVFKGDGRWDEGGERNDPNHDDWPTFAQSRETRVFIHGQDYGLSSYIHEEDYVNGSVEALTAFPDCRHPNGNQVLPYQQPFDQFKQFYPENTEQMTATQVRAQTDCGFDSIKMNDLLAPGDRRLTEAVFSWGVGNPPEELPDGTAAIISQTDSLNQPRWTPFSPDAVHPFLCERVPASGRFIHVEPSYRVVGSGTWAEGFGVCSAERDADGRPFRLATPRNGFDNLLAREALEAAGQNHAWLSLVKRGNDRHEGWKIADGGLILIGPSEWDDVTMAGFSVHADLPVESISWTVSSTTTGGAWDDAAQPGGWLAVWFTRAGTYQVTATVRLSGGVELAPISKDVTVTSLDGIELISPAEVTEGTTYEGRVESHFPITSIFCLPSAANIGAVTAATVSGAVRYTTNFSCPIPVTSDSSQDLLIESFSEDVGYLVERMTLTVLDAGPATVTPLERSISVVNGSWFNVELDLFDTPGERVYVRVQGSNDDRVIWQLIQSVPHKLVIPFLAGTDWADRELRFDVSDTTIFSDKPNTHSVYLVTSHPLGPSASITGPEYSSSGSTADYTVTATSIDNNPPVLGSTSCGTVGSVVAAFIIDTNTNSRRFLMRCAFLGGNPDNRVSLEVRGSDGGRTSATMRVDVAAGPEISIREKPEPTERNVFMPGVMFPGIEKWYEISVRPQYGQSAVAHHVTCGDGADVTGGPSLVYHDGETNLRRYYLLCTLKSGAAATTVTASYRDGRGYISETVTIGAIRAKDVQVTAPAPIVVSKPGTTTTVGFLVQGEGKLALYAASCGAKSLSQRFIDNGPLKITCVAPSAGSVMTVSVTVQSPDMRRTASTTITVPSPDHTPPTLNLPVPGPVVEATGPLTAVGWSVDAEDDVDDELSVICSPAAGTAFPIGATSVFCNTSDAAKNVITGSFIVTVQDTTAPVVTIAPPAPVPATDGHGAAVMLSVTATDVVTSPSIILCSPANGSVFPIGATEVVCSSTDDRGNTGSAYATVTVLPPPDTTAPEIEAPVVVSAEAASSSGAAVTFAAAATDNRDGAVAVTCTPSSGTTFQLGVTSVTCTAADAAGNTASHAITVTVADTIAPSLTGLVDIVMPATSPAGALVTLNVGATDLVTPSPSISCSHQSGLFPVGETVMTCTATDNAANHSSASIVVRITADAVPPAVTVPSPISISTPAGTDAVVTYLATAVDDRDGALGTTCAPASGSVFPVGVTTVTCTATDAFGNTGSAAFEVSVTVAEVTTAGEMTGVGSLGDDDARYHFSFHVRERLHGGERARFELRVDRNDGRKGRRERRRDDNFLARTTDYVAFKDDPNLTQNGRQRPPQVDTVWFSGVGRWNGDEGYRYEVQAADEGRTGRRHRESIRIVITAPNGTVVASIDDEIDRGWIQSVRIRH